MRTRSASEWLRSAGERYFRFITVAATLVVGAAVTIHAWRDAEDTVAVGAQREFETQAASIGDALRGRMIDYAQVLRGGAGLFAASHVVTRQEWRAYVEALRIELSYPGIQALGVIFEYDEPELAAHVESMRREGFRRYAVRPPGVRRQYAPVVYTEPQNERNLRVLGFDMYFEPARRAAINRARDTGEPAISGKVTLQQEGDSDAQPGVLMFLPVYRKDLPSDRIEDRRSGVVGYLYAAFRTRDLMGGALGAIPNVRIEVFDGLMPDTTGLLYDSAPALVGELHPHYVKTMQMVVQDRIWTLRATSLPQFEKAIDRTRPNATIAAGVAVSLLLSALVWALATLRERALRLARSMTAELRDSRERLSLALEGSDLALFDFDVTSGRVTLSPRWSVLLGGRAEVTTTTIEKLRELVHPDDMPRVREALARTLKGETPFYHVEHRVLTSDGTWKWIASHAKVTERGDDGLATRITGTNADISARKAVEDLKNDFIGTVSHELRTPLTAVIGSLSLLKEEYGGSLDSDAGQFLDMAYQNSERLAALVNDILDLEKIESGRLELRIERVELGAFLERALAMNAPYAEKHGTRFTLDPVEPGIAVCADADRLLQVVTNLLSNAAKYSPDGEPVTITARSFDDRARVEVTDRGPGVPAEFQSRLFTRFAQAESGGKGGTGLGLAISKAMVEAMLGTIGYENGADRGATFFFELPLAAGDVATAERRRLDRRRGARRQADP
jgi:PAS domain S-box-containing protein